MAEQVVVPADSSAVAAALVRSQLRTPEDVIHFVSDGHALLDAPPGASETELRRLRVERRVRIDRKLQGRVPGDPGDRANSALSSLALLGAIVPGGHPKDIIDGLGGVFSAVISSPRVQDYITGERQVAAAQSKADLLALYEKSVPEMVHKLRAAAATNPAIKKNLHEEWSFLLDGDLDSAGQCVTNHPQVFNRYTTVKVQADNSVVVSAIDQMRADMASSLADLTGSIGQQVQDSNAQLAVMNESIADLSGGVGRLADLISTAHHPTPRSQELHERIEQARSEIAATGGAALQNAQQLTAAAAFFASLIGEDKLAADITRFGASAVRVGESILGVANAGASLALALATANPIGMVSAAADLFGSALALSGLWDSAAPQPAPEEMILVEVRRLHQQLDEISDQIERSFALVDDRLITMHRQTMTALGQLAAEQRVTRQLVEQVHSTLVSVQQRLTLIDRGILQMFQDATAHDLNIAIERGLGYRDRDPTGEGLSFTQFDACASEFYLWCTTVARNSIYQPLNVTDTSDEHLADELSKGSLASNVCLINKALLHRNLPGLAPDSSPGSRLARLANSDVWAVAANAYAQLQAEWPKLADPTDTRRQGITEVGLDLADACRALASSPVFAPLINGRGPELAGYRGRMLEFTAAINAQLPRFHHDVLPGLLNRTPDEVGPIDLFGPPNQTPPLQSWLLPTTMTGGGPALPAPRDGLARHIPADLALHCLLTQQTLALSCRFGQYRRTEE